LDNNHVLYGISSGNVLLGASADIWLVSTDKTASPQLFLKNAFSPAVFRSQEQGFAEKSTTEIRRHEEKNHGP
jgi:hypothetical protein